jgi:hypothetical protein
LTSRLGNAAAAAYAQALGAAATPANSSSDGASDGMETARNILRAASATRRAFTSDPDTLLGLAARDNPHPLVTALIEALSSDDPILPRMRQIFFPKEGESLTDHVARGKRNILTVIRLTARPDGWTARELDQLASLSSNTADPDVAKAAFDALSLAGYERGLVEVFDAIMRSRGSLSDAPDELTFRAIRGFARASTLTRDRTNLYGRERVDWLLDRFPVAGLRGWVVRALAQRPENTTVDQDRFAYLLVRAVASGHGDTTGLCADAATLGPFSGDALAVELLELSQKQDYENEDWAPACVAWLAPTRSAGGLTEHGETFWLLSLRDGTLQTQDPAPKQLATAFELWSQSKGDPNGRLLRRKLATRAAALAPNTGWGASDFKALWDWDSELSGEFVDEVWPVRKAWLLRGGLLLLLGIPSAVFIHLAFWGAMLIAYPRSGRVQTHVFYNPLARKILGLGYVDLLLVWIGPLRRLIFEPFAESMLGELGRVALGAKEGPYYRGSQVAKLDLLDIAVDLREAESAALSGKLENAPTPVLGGLSTWSGPTCLFGPSGRGKTSYLRHVLATMAPTRTPFVYLRASECGDDLVATVCERLPGLGRDTDLIISLVRSGLLDVYVDGLNEVDRTRQEKIVQFVVGNPRANVFVTSQEVGISFPRRLAAYYLLPLTREQMREFLLSREPVLDANAPIRGEAYTKTIDAFLDRLSDEDVAVSAGGSGSVPAHQILMSFLATLANPMDLDTASVLLSLDIEPDPFRLREQQFQLVDEDCRSQLGRPFPIDAFSKSALEARESNKPEIDASSFGEYVAILDQRKQVRRISIRIADGWGTEYRFRHDKISDFYLHFALMEPDSEKRFELAGDDRFAGLYDYLARELC